MTLLAIDTSSFQLCIGLLRGDSYLEFSPSQKETSSSQLLPAIEEVLRSQKLSIDDIDVFGVSLGPGSFTGLRVGLATIKGLALPDRKKIAGFSTLEALALPVLDHEKITVATHARKGYVYLGRYRRGESSLVSIGGAEEIPFEEIAKKIDSKTCLLGSGIRECEEELRQSLPDTVIFLDPSMDTPKGRALLELSLEKVGKSDFLDLDLAEPIYLKPSAAEMNMEQKAENR